MTQVIFGYEDFTEANPFVKEILNLRDRGSVKFGTISLSKGVIREASPCTLVALTLININRRPYGNPMGSDLTKGQRSC